MGTGKDYRKRGGGMEGAALFLLALQRSGSERLMGADEIIRSTLRDLGVTRPQVESYIEAHRGELEAKLGDGGKSAEGRN
ncbi:hypothetical protein K8I61_06940 [bacterium]|nr:hypothetical protein [bacterium]